MLHPKIPSGSMTGAIPGVLKLHTGSLQKYSNFLSTVKHSWQSCQATHPLCPVRVPRPIAT